jgi:hypothetical protein
MIAPDVQREYVVNLISRLMMPLMLIVLTGVVSVIGVIAFATLNKVDQQGTTLNTMSSDVLYLRRDVDKIWTDVNADGKGRFTRVDADREIGAIRSDIEQIEQLTESNFTDVRGRLLRLELVAKE